MSSQHTCNMNFLLGAVPGALLGFIVAPRGKGTACTALGFGTAGALSSWKGKCSDPGLGGLGYVFAAGIGAIGAIGKGIYLGISKASEKKGGSKKKVNPWAVAAGVGFPVAVIGGLRISHSIKEARLQKLKETDTRGYCEKLAYKSSVNVDTCMRIQEDEKAARQRLEARATSGFLGQWATAGWVVR